MKGDDSPHHHHTHACFNRVPRPWPKPSSAVQKLHMRALIRWWAGRSPSLPGGVLVVVIGDVTALMMTTTMMIIMMMIMITTRTPA